MVQKSKQYSGQCAKCNREFTRPGPQKIHENVCGAKKQKDPTFHLADISTKLPNGSYSCNVCGEAYKRAGIGSHWWLNHGDGGEHLKVVSKRVDDLHQSRIGIPSWNSGLTMENNASIKQASDTAKRKFASGENIHPYKGKTISLAAREKISAFRSNLLNTKGSGPGNFRFVKWYDSENLSGDKFKLRGTWELKTAEWLNSHGIDWTRNVLLKYAKDGFDHSYSPDFVILSTNLVLEVKGYFMECDKIKMKLVAERNPEIKIVMLFEKDIKDLDSALAFLLATKQPAK